MSDFTIRGGFGDLAVSSRVRLARNLVDLPFRLNAAQQKQVADRVMQAFAQTPALAQDFTCQTVQPNTAEGVALAYAHLISPALAAEGGYVILSQDRAVSIMIGEEDHLRLQVIGKGLCPKECLQTAERLAAVLEDALGFAKNDRLGYLTACPTNVGTGLRASVMLHLPVITRTGMMERIVGFAGHNGCAVRGAYGEGSDAVGGFYQISNQITLGRSAKELCCRLIDITTDIIDAETKARARLLSEQGDALRDRVFRAAGTAGNAWLMQTGEAIACISDLLVGLQLGLLSGLSSEQLYEIIPRLQPALLQGNSAERDKKRAAMLREGVKGIQRIEE